MWCRLPAVVGGVALLTAGCALAAPEAKRPVVRALVAADGRHVTVLSAARVEATCGVSRLTAREDARLVTLTLEWTPDDGPCALSGGSSSRTAVLDKPLASRELVDGATGNAIPHLDGKHLVQIGYVPPGYKFTNDGFGSGPNQWTRVYSTPGLLAQRLEITQSHPGSQPLDSSPVQRRVTVAGHSVEIRVLAMDARTVRRALTWTADNDSFAIISGVSGAVGAESQTPLPETELFRIIESLRHGESP